MAKKTRGKCKYCGRDYTLSYMMRHLPVCEERQKIWGKETKGRRCGYFELVVCGKYDRDYWLCLEVKETALLEDLDSFLRDIWLECCGHLSSFDINGDTYDIDPPVDFAMFEPAHDMKCKLDSVLEEGMMFDYQYDFGSTTELEITVAGYRKGGQKREKITILSRNDPPELVCAECGKNPAEFICTECAWDGVGLLCAKCAKTHACGMEMLLPVCNSPRMGVCAYEGSENYPDQFEPDVRKS